MISPGLQTDIDNIFFDPTLTDEQKHYQIVNLFSELEEYCTGLEEKIDKLEYDLGLTGLEGDSRCDNEK